MLIVFYGIFTCPNLFKMSILGVGGANMVYKAFDTKLYCKYNKDLFIGTLLYSCIQGCKAE